MFPFAFPSPGWRNPSCSASQCTLCTPAPESSLKHQTHWKLNTKNCCWLCYIHWYFNNWECIPHCIYTPHCKWRLGNTFEKGLLHVSFDGINNFSCTLTFIISETVSKSGLNKNPYFGTCEIWWESSHWKRACPVYCLQILWVYVTWS